MIPDYTAVVGVDRKHLQQLSWTWPTWKKHKPGLLECPMIIFRDRVEVTEDEIRAVVDHPLLRVVHWPPEDVDWEGDGKDKWSNPQRAKMLAGFVHVPAIFCRTPYWLKIDTDVVATGMDDWIAPEWFASSPDIIAHPWSFTKPPDQILKLDAWVEANKDKFVLAGEPLRIAPKPGADRVGHKRVISWCGLFKTAFTLIAHEFASVSCDRYQLPVPSQDGYLWYLAARTHPDGIVRVSMKNRGWMQWSTSYNVQRHAAEAMR